MNKDKEREQFWEEFYNFYPEFKIDEGMKQ